MNKKIGFLILLLCGSVLGSGCAKNAEKTQEIPLLEPAEAVIQTEEVIYRDLYEVTVRDGEYAPYTEELSFEEGGTIENVFVKLGQTVEKGELLAEMDQNAYINAETNAANRYWEAIMERDNEIKRLEQLLKKAQTAEERKFYNLSIQQTQDAYVANEKLLKKEWDEARAKLGNNIIEAPFDGVITALRSKGDRVENGKAALAISDLSRGVVVADGYLSASDAAKYDRFFAIINGNRVPLSYDEKMQKETDTYTLFQTVGKENVAFGDFVSVCLIKNLHEHVLSIPKKLVTRENQKNYVYVLEGERSTRREIQIGYSNELFVEVTDGLKEGDRVYAK